MLAARHALRARNANDEVTSTYNPALRIRGGAEEDEDAEALSDDQILEKLNAIPTFALMYGEDQTGFVGLEMKQGGKAISFFTDPVEAQAVLNMTSEASPGTPIRLACVGLGNALKLCQRSGGFFDSTGDDPQSAVFNRFDGALRLAGSHDVVADTAEKLRAMLESAGIAEGDWTFPVFMCARCTDFTSRHVDTSLHNSSLHFN